MQSLCFSIINPLWGEGGGGWDLKLQLLASHCAPAGHVNLSIHLYLNNLYTFRLTEPAKPSKRKFTPVISSSSCQGRHLKVWKRKPQWVTHPFPLTWKSRVDLLLLTLQYYMSEITYYCMPGPFFSLFMIFIMLLISYFLFEGCWKVTLFLISCSWSIWWKLIFQLGCWLSRLLNNV